ncbi:FitA-like ribbon-helix-helix domain-containing protein [Streptomyces sp. NPDC088923]|uniref:FitA-like ribbon-helix-helix domain-containing protein n=1 Tax=Streptomyces sp. NPDC088923 TaxID=3365913 RepID=UPI0037F41628
MATVQIRNLDEEAYAILRRRAAESGRSLQEYLRIEVEELARRPSIDEILDDLRDHAVSDVTMDEIVAMQREGRDR